MVTKKDVETLFQSVTQVHFSLIPIFGLANFNGATQRDTKFMSMTTRKCLAILHTDSWTVFDVLVVEVAKAARGRGLFKYWLAHTLLDFASNKTLLRFHNVQSVKLQNYLIQLGFILEGDYFCCYAPKLTLDRMGITDAKAKIGFTPGKLLKLGAQNGTV